MPRGLTAQLIFPPTKKPLKITVLISGRHRHYDSSSIGSFAMDSPRTAWNMRQEQMGRAQKSVPQKSQQKSAQKPFEKDSSSSISSTENESVIENIRKSDGSKSGSRTGTDVSRNRKQTSINGAEHVDGYFRNLVRN